LEFNWIILLQLNNLTSLTIKLLKIYFNIFLKKNNNFIFKKLDKIFPYYINKKPLINFLKIYQMNHVLLCFKAKQNVIHFLNKLYLLKLIPYIFIPIGLLKYNNLGFYYPL